MMSYKAWMREVDKIVAATCGLNMDLLPDWLSRDAYEDGLTPKEGAEACLEEAGYYSWVNEDMDGDNASALASAGFGTDEDYRLFDEA